MMCRGGVGRQPRRSRRRRRSAHLLLEIAEQLGRSTEPRTRPWELASTVRRCSPSREGACLGGGEHWWQERAEAGAMMLSRNATMWFTESAVASREVPPYFRRTRGDQGRSRDPCQTSTGNDNAMIIMPPRPSHSPDRSAYRHRCRRGPTGSRPQAEPIVTDDVNGRRRRSSGRSTSRQVEDGSAPRGSTSNNFRAHELGGGNGVPVPASRLTRTPHRPRGRPRRRVAVDCSCAGGEDLEHMTRQQERARRMIADLLRDAMIDRLRRPLDPCHTIAAMDATGFAPDAPANGR